MPTPVADLSLVEVARRLKSRRVSAHAVLDACLERIATRDGELNAFITLAIDEARDAARRTDAGIRAGRYRGPLDGVPVSVKDIVDVRGLPTTAASRVRAGHVADRDAPIVTRLRRAGAIIIGKCNLHEFALGTTGEDSAYGPTRHPYDRSRSPGGSSSGSAVSVATGMAFGSIGSDTGGSIRIPAAACGIVGLKPSFGELSLDGVVPLAWTLDHVGPLARTVGDAWLLYRALAGDRVPPPLRRTARVPGRLTLGLLGGYFRELVDPEVKGSFDRAVSRLRKAGCVIPTCEVTHAEETSGIYVSTVLPEAAVFHARTLEGRPHDYSPNVRQRLEAGRAIPTEEYLRAQHRRAVLRQEVDAALVGRDALVLPTVAVPATPLGAEKLTIGHVTAPLRMLTLRLTQLFNLTGHPAVSIPCGTTSSGLPCGLQLVGRFGRTADLMRLAVSLEATINGAGSPEFLVPGS